MASCVGERSGGLYRALAKEESERLVGEGDGVKFIDLRFERWQVVRFTKGRKQDLP